MRFALWTLPLMIPASLAAAPAPVSPEPAADPNPLRAALLAAAERGDYAEYGGTSVTWAEMEAYFAQTTGFRRPLPWEPGEAADQIAGNIAWAEMNLDAAFEAARTTGWLDLDQYHQQRRLLIHQQLLRTAAFEMPAISTEEARAHYEAHLEDYALPFQFWMRHIFLSCYETHRVEEGETPTSIAEAIAGDRAAALEIRAMNHRRLVSGWDVPVDEIDERVGPLPAGFRLLVPGGPGRRAEVRARLAEIRESIHSEADFIAAARQFSEVEVRNRGEEIGPLPQRGEEFLPELEEIGRTLPIGEVSDIVETKHGFQLAMVTRRTGDQHRPFEDVRESIVSALRRERRNELMLDWMRGLLQGRGIAVDDVSSAEFAAADASSERVVARLQGEDPITLGELRANWEGLNTAQRARYAERPEEYLLAHLLFERTDVLDEIAEEESSAWMAPLLHIYDLVTVAEPFISHQIAEAAAQITEEDLLAQYGASPERYRQPARVSYDEIALRADPPSASPEEGVPDPTEMLMDQLAESLESVDSLSAFRRVLAEYAIDLRAVTASPERSSQFRDVPLEAVPIEVRAQLASAEPNTVIGPFANQRLVRALWLISRTDDYLPPFEEMRSRVSLDVQAQRRSTLNTQQRSEALERERFELVRPDPVPAPSEATEP